MDAELPLAGVRCGQCGYCLHGLAARGRCPECGTRYCADLYGPQAPNYAALLLPAITLAMTWSLAAGSAHTHAAIRWLCFLSFALAIVWAKRVAIKIAQAAYLDRLAATPIDQPPLSRAWYFNLRSILYFLTELALAVAVLFLVIALLARQFATSAG